MSDVSSISQKLSVRKEMLQSSSKTIWLFVLAIMILFVPNCEHETGITDAMAPLTQNEFVMQAMSVTGEYTAERLGTIPGTSQSLVVNNSINDDGLIAGYTINDVSISFRWEEGEMQSLPNYSDSYGVADHCWATSLNNHGYVAGTCAVDEEGDRLPTDGAYPVVWDGGTLEASRLKSGEYGDRQYYFRFDMNDNIEVVWSIESTDDKGARGLFWSGINDYLIELQPLNGDNTSWVYTINNNGDVAGLSRMNDSRTFII